MEASRITTAAIVLFILTAPLAGLPHLAGNTPDMEQSSIQHPIIQPGSTAWRNDESSGCKDIVAVDAATRGNYSLLLKVRDPSRPGYQVLCPIEAGYEYTYHHPWTGLPMHFTVQHRFIGTTSAEDVPPGIIKPGMLMSDAGLAFGDADTLSYRVNPTRHAWDDFDWMRYAAQSADTFDEAVQLLTEDAIGRLHCTSVPENIFVASPYEAAIIEADAYTYRTRQVNDVAVQSNYPKVLWQTYLMYPLLVAPSFNSTYQGTATAGDIVRLGSLGGIRVIDTSQAGITVRALPFGAPTDIDNGEGAPVGSYYVEVHASSASGATLSISYKYHTWETLLRQRITARQGDITLQDMFTWSRLHSHDISGLRGMCQGGYEAATVYRLQQRYPATLSSLWFAPNQCSAIYVPVHIYSQDIYDPYETGEAHRVAMQLLERYGHGNLTEMYTGPEARFIEEVATAEHEAMQLLDQGRGNEAVELLTLTDLRIQMEALAVMQLWLNLSRLPSHLASRLALELLDIWSHNDGQALPEAMTAVSRAMHRYPGYMQHLGCIQRLLSAIAAIR